MATYRPVDIRIWHDRKFLSCSDDGRMLWLFLLTTTFAKSIPGVIVAGDGAMSEELGWYPSRLGRAFLEIQGRGLAVRREGRLTWLSNALKYQPVGGENAIVGMGKIWDDIPDGALKLEIWEALKIALKRWPGLFAKHLPKPLGQPLTQPPTQGGGRQDQEQEQDQKQDQDLEDSDTASRVGSRELEQFKLEADQLAVRHNARHAHPRKPKPSEPTPDERAAAGRVLEKLSARNGIAYSGTAEHVRLIVAQLRNGVPEMDLRYVIGYCADELGWQDDADLSKYLRPETLFGPKTIAKYLDPARAWVAKNNLAPKREAS